MKKIIHATIGIISIFVISSLVLPRFIDLNVYKTVIEDELYKRTHCKIEIIGDIKLSILPEPSLNIRHVKLINSHDLTKSDFLTIHEIRIKFNLLSLFTRQFEISRILLKRPKMIFRQSKKGHKDHLDDLKNNFIGGSTGVESPPGTKPSSSMKFNIDTLEIVSGEINYITPTAEHKIHDLTTTLKADSLNGPYKVEGFLKYIDQDIRFQLKIKQLADLSPLKLKLELNSTELSLEGMWSQSTQQFQGNLDAHTNAKALEAIVKNILPTTNFPDFINGPLNLNGRLMLSAHDLVVDNLTVDIDQESINGRFASKLSPLSVNVDLTGIPGKTSVVFDAHKKDSKLTGHWKLISGSPHKLIKWLMLPSFVHIPDPLTGLSKLDVDYTIDGSLITLKDIELKIKNSVINGVIEADIDHHDYKYDLSLQGVMPIAQYLHFPLHREIDVLRTIGTSKLQDDIIIFNNNMNVAGTSLESVGQIKLAQDYQANVTIRAKADDAQPLCKLFYNDLLPLDYFDISSTLTLDTKVINFDDINIKLSSYGMPLNFNGYIHTQVAGRHLIDAELSTGSVKLDRLNPIVFESISNAALSLKSHDVQPTNDRVATTKYWSSVPINLSFLNTFDGKFKITSDRISYQDLLFKNFTMSASLNQGLLDVSNFTADFFNGKLQGMLNIDTSTESKWSAQLTIQDAILQQSKSASDAFKIIKGIVNANSVLNSSGKSIDDWMNNLNGRLHFDASDGILSGFDLKSLTRQLKSIKKSVSVSALLKNAMAQGTTDFNNYSATINFEKGMGTFQNLSLLTSDVKASGVSSVNLPAFQIDLTGEFSFSEMTMLPPLIMHLLGAANNPEKSFDTQAVEKYFADHVFSSNKFGAKSIKTVGDFLNDLVNRDQIQNKGLKSKSLNNDDPKNIKNTVEKPLTEIIKSIL